VMKVFKALFLRWGFAEKSTMRREWNVFVTLRG
jgi:hypothetical protein